MAENTSIRAGKVNQNRWWDTWLKGAKTTQNFISTNYSFLLKEGILISTVSYCYPASLLNYRTQKIIFLNAQKSKMCPKCCFPFPSLLTPWSCIPRIPPFESSFLCRANWSLVTADSFTFTTPPPQKPHSSGYFLIEQKSYLPNWILSKQALYNRHETDIHPDKSLPDHDTL